MIVADQNLGSKFVVVYVNLSVECGSLTGMQILFFLKEKMLYDMISFFLDNGYKIRPLHQEKYTANYYNDCVSKSNNGPA